MKGLEMIRKIAAVVLALACSAFAQGRKHMPSQVEFHDEDDRVVIMDWNYVDAKTREQFKTHQVKAGPHECVEMNHQTRSRAARRRPNRETSRQASGWDVAVPQQNIITEYETNYGYQGYAIRAYYLIDYGVYLDYTGTTQERVDAIMSDLEDQYDDSMAEFINSSNEWYAFKIFVPIAVVYANWNTLTEETEATDSMDEAIELYDTQSSVHLVVRVTGVDICFGGSCSIVGGAYTGGMCESDAKGIIFEQLGDVESDANVLTHELGHSLGLNHSSISLCPDDVMNALLDVTTIQTFVCEETSSSVEDMEVYHNDISGCRQKWCLTDDACNQTLNIDGCDDRECDADGACVEIEDDDCEDCDSDWNCDGIASVVSDVGYIEDCLFYGDCDDVCVDSADCNGSGFLSIVGDLPCALDCFLNTNCDCPSPAPIYDGLQDRNPMAAAKIDWGGMIIEDLSNPFSTGITGMDIDMDCPGTMYDEFNLDSESEIVDGLWIGHNLPESRSTTCTVTFTKSGWEFRDRTDGIGQLSAFASSPFSIDVSFNGGIPTYESIVIEGQEQ